MPSKRGRPRTKRYVQLLFRRRCSCLFWSCENHSTLSFDLLPHHAHTLILDGSHAWVIARSVQLWLPHRGHVNV